MDSLSWELNWLGWGSANANNIYNTKADWILALCPADERCRLIEF